MWMLKATSIAHVAIIYATLPFVADAPVAAKYTIEARSGAAVQTQGIDVAVPVSPLVFSF